MASRFPRSHRPRPKIYNVIYSFTDAHDGAQPFAGLTSNRSSFATLYGTTAGGGYNWGDCQVYYSGCGTVFELKNLASGSVLTPLYNFAGGNDGANPLGRVTVSNFELYGTTTYGGGIGCGLYGCGTVFKLAQPMTPCKTSVCPWVETVLYRFQGTFNDGAYPLYGDVTLDRMGDIYGTTSQGGSGWSCPNGCGIVYKLTALTGYKESVLYNFTDGTDGAYPYGGVVLDSAGNLYGTTNEGGAYGNGTVFKLVPNGSSWREVTLYAFGQNPGDGCNPAAGLIFDHAGNLYGTNEGCGANNGGTVFQLMPQNGSWTENVLYDFTGTSSSGPHGSVAMDTAGNLYGTTANDGINGNGSVYELSPPGSWTMYTDLYDFGSSGNTYGSVPYGNVIIDSSGNIYGTASGGGSHNWGVIWDITNSSMTAANEFQVSADGSVSEIDVAVGYVGGTNSFYLNIATDNGGQPGTMLASFFNLSSTQAFGGCCRLVSITGISGVDLVAGTNYWIVIGPTALNSTTSEEWNLNTTNATGTDLYSTDGGRTWISRGKETLGTFDVLGSAATLYSNLGTGTDVYQCCSGWQVSGSGGDGAKP